MQLKYHNVTDGVFVKRLNRFCAEVLIDGKVCMCHVKNTGRLGELLLKDAKVYLEDHGETPNRKTRYSLVAVEKDGYTVNIDSVAPNVVFGEWVRNGGFLPQVTLIKPECKYKNSRFDYYIEAQGRKFFVEIKGVTLERDGLFLFPDAPTERGAKHLHELCESIKEGYEAYAVFVVQMKRQGTFVPNVKMDENFANALKNATKCGVKVICVNCNATRDSLEIADRIDVCIGE